MRGKKSVMLLLAFVLVLALGAAGCQTDGQAAPSGGEGAAGLPEIGSGPEGDDEDEGTADIGGIGSGAGGDENSSGDGASQAGPGGDGVDQTGAGENGNGDGGDGAAEAGENGGEGDGLLPDDEDGFEIERISKEESLDAEDGTALFRGDLYYPRLHIPENQEAENRINQVFEEQEEADTQQMEEYKEYAKERYGEETREKDYWTNYAYSNDFMVTCNNKSLLSVKELTYSYAGGVHPNSMIDAWNFDCTIGEKVEWSGLADEPEVFQAFLKDAVLRQLEEGQFEDGSNVLEWLYPDYEETLAEVLAEPVWYVDGENLMFVFNEYVLAPYAAGILEYGVPLADCAPYFNHYAKELLQIS